MAIGNYFYGAGDSVGKLYDSQANQSQSVGINAADIADPFRNERKTYQNSLRSLMSNPGEFSSSPFYKFAYDQGLNSLQRKGNVRSGNKLAELMKFGQGMASQTFFPQANLLASLSGATTGSPAAAGLAVSGAFNRSQDQRLMGQASRMMGSGGQGGGYNTGGLWDSDFYNSVYSGTYRSPGSSASAPNYYTPNYGYDSSSYSPSSGFGYIDTGYGSYDYSPGMGFVNSPSYFEPDYGYQNYYTPSYGDDFGYDYSSPDYFYGDYE